ncbi:biotin-dependent carboxyltransferase [Labrys sp. LIt4]|uniref:5-oxoprolinase subunit C family protein n=1 Tax=Labrys sp. LIt4 TaxID=2821355 RepID=UPI001ADEEE33|nr:biotin-dependent carboxyltransferase family protein [Labrys sp. LIt4]MBP0580295.1 biotin-dependent carboxyltransferase [Labrys sp. LIt4]
MGVRVLNPGLSTTVQDLGRPGYFHLGIPVGGAMDRLALRAANLLVGNDEADACLEAVFLGPELEFTRDATIAVTGGEMPIKIDGVEQPSWTALRVRAGQTLSFGFLKAGARIYIAIGGGFDVPLALGSRSTYVIGALGGHKGRALAKGDELAIGEAGTAKEGRSVPEALRRRPGAPAQLRVLPGLYWHRIQEQSGRAFFEDQWKVAPEADRMGYRFRGGRPLHFVEREPPFGAGSDPSNIVDSCYPYGSIQVPSGTEPIILHRDAVSGGGYFMLGTVISADMDLIGQMQPNTPTQFVEVDMATALAARAERAALLTSIRAALASN